MKDDGLGLLRPPVFVKNAGTIVACDIAVTHDLHVSMVENRKIIPAALTRSAKAAIALPSRSACLRRLLCGQGRKKHACRFGRRTRVLTGDEAPVHDRV